MEDVTQSIEQPLLHSVQDADGSSIEGTDERTSEVEGISCDKSGAGQSEEAGFSGGMSKYCDDIMDSDSNSSEDEPEDLSQLNRDFRPFRDGESLDKVNAHVLKAEAARVSRTRNTDSMMSTRSRTSVDPEQVRARVKSQMKKKQIQQKHRRIRKAGEAAVVTRARRENRENIKTSIGADWY